jgi:LysR family transcriptional regulator, low CO2-responsive transcriptional regulator
VSRLYAVTQRYSRREEALTLAGSHGPCSHLLPSLIEAFSPRYPAARIKLRLGSSPEIEKWLSMFEVDLAVVSNRIMSSSLQTEPFRNEKLIAFVVPSHPLARKRSIPMSEFGDIRLIVKIRREGQSRTEAQLNEFAKKGIKFKTVIRCESSQSLKETVRHGQGVGILFQDTIKPEIDQEEFVAVQFARLNVVRQTHIAYSKERPLSPSARGFLSLLRASATNSTIIKPMTRQISNGQQTVAPGRLGVEAFMTSKSGAKSSLSKIGLGPR